MKRGIGIWIVVLLLSVGFLYAAGNGNDFEFPEWFVLAMNALIVPFVVQWVKKITDVRELRAVIAAILSFATAWIGIVITGQGGNILQLLILAYAVSQIAYNLWWHAILQGSNK